MTDAELFNAVLNRFCESYNLSVERPFNNGFMIIKNAYGEVIAEFNTDGYNLLYNLDRLVTTLRPELE